MSAKITVAGILSLSAASIALFQSASIANGGPSETTLPPSDQLSPELASKYDHLLLAPPHQEELLRMYARHSSHASHPSHYSGSGGGYGGYSTPQVPPGGYYVPTTPAPVAHPSVAPAQPKSPQTPINTSVLAESIKRRAARGSVDGQYTMGKYYLEGTNGFEKCIDRAQLSLELAVVQGDPEAKRRLETLTPTKQVSDPKNVSQTINPPGMKPAEEKNPASDVLLKAAAEGSADAQLALGLQYLQGRDGLEKNVEKAELMLELAVLQGNETAKAKLLELQRDSASEVKKSTPELEKSEK